MVCHSQQVFPFLSHRVWETWQHKASDVSSSAEAAWIDSSSFNVASLILSLYAWFHKTESSVSPINKVLWTSPSHPWCSTDILSFTVYPGAWNESVTLRRRRPRQSLMHNVLPCVIVVVAVVIIDRTASWICTTVLIQCPPLARPKNAC